MVTQVSSGTPIPAIPVRIRAHATALVLLAASCSGGEPSPVDTGTGVVSIPVASVRPVDIAADGTLPLAEQALDDPDVTSVATDLAPSQITAPTVPEPSTPPPCTADDIAIWTARVERDGPTVDAVIRMRNASDDWCEPDIGRSPLLNPAIEPDVWLRPGEAADLRVGQMTADCAEPVLVTLVQVGVGTGSIVVPSAVVTCGWWLDAFAPLNPVTEPCTTDGLEWSVTGPAVVVRTVMGPCVLGAVLTAERDDGADVLADRPGAWPEFAELYPGDVALIGAASGAGCVDPSRPVTLALATTGDLSIDEVACDMRFWSGAAAPWFGSEFGPTSELPSGSSDVGPALDALDPFAWSE